MEKKRLGVSNLSTFPLVFGGNVFGWTVDEKTSFQLLDAFIGEGFDFVDTADVYSAWVTGNRGGESESILGNWFAKSGKRKKVILATKVGMEITPNRKGLSKKYILESVEGSLKRLQTDYIDLYQAHKDDLNTPLEETLEAFDLLIRQGKVLAIGASNYTGTRLQAALDCSKKNGWASFQSLQPCYHLCDRKEYETDLEPVCEKNKLGVISYYSLANGFLTGKYRAESDLAGSARGIRVKKYFTKQGLTILGALDQVAKEQGTTLAKAALAWVLARPSITAPIASATTITQLKELMEGVQLQLTPQSLNLLDAASKGSSTK